VRVEAAFAVGAEQVGDAHRGLAQHELQVAMSALGANFADAAKGLEGQGLAIAVEVVDDQARIEFAEDKIVVGRMVAAAAPGLIVCVIWRSWDMYSHLDQFSIVCCDTLRGSKRQANLHHSQN
jgi:hypothetical protein